MSGKLTKQWRTFRHHLDANGNYHPDDIEDLTNAVQEAVGLVTGLGMMCRGISNRKEYIRTYDPLFEQIMDVLLLDTRCIAVVEILTVQALQQLKGNMN